MNALHKVHKGFLGRYVTVYIGSLVTITFSKDGSVSIWGCHKDAQVGQYHTAVTPLEIIALLAFAAKHSWTISAEMVHANFTGDTKSAAELTIRTYGLGAAEDAACLAAWDTAWRASFHAGRLASYPIEHADVLEYIRSCGKSDIEKRQAIRNAKKRAAMKAKKARCARLPSVAEEDGEEEVDDDVPIAPTVMTAPPALPNDLSDTCTRD